jgi:membrane peptidoglycan carboxypeptidase
MYTNQFFVTGFGSGLQVASQYFFNKDAEKLDLVEASFIAGSVKGPYKYNPFIKKTEEEKAEARNLAKLRKDYVLLNMLRLKYISPEEYAAAKEKAVPFQEGKVTFGLNVILDYIREQLESEYFKTILQEQGINNIATSGIKIYTSVNKQIQEGALQSLRTRLPLIDTKLSGYKREALQVKYKEITDNLLANSEVDFPIIAKITNINAESQNPSFQVAWDNGHGIINYDGLQPIGEAWLKSRLGNWAVLDKKYAPDFIKNFQVGDLVLVQSKDVKTDSDSMPLALSKVPEVDGGIVVLQNGMIKAMVGGFFDRFFNRAVDAKRQLGSIFKPIVYTAALQLKWNGLDPLINQKNIFPFEKSYYVPNREHEPQSELVSMTWAGAKSENIATVWLLYHLSDYLNKDEFSEMVSLVGLNQKKEESYTQYVERIRDKQGIVVDDAALTEAVFAESKKEIETDLIFNGYEDSILTLRNLYYSINPAVFDKKEEYRSLAPKLSFKELIAANLQMKKQLAGLKELAVKYREAQTPELLDSLSKAIQSFYLLQDESGSPKLVFTNSPSPLDPKRFEVMSPEWYLEHESKLPEVSINALLPSEVIDLVQENMKETYKKLQAYKRYEPEILYEIRDFRLLTHLLYVTRLAQDMGISSKLDPVLSFPLGANAISITEAALAYQTLMTGTVFPLEKTRNIAMVPVITKITDREGTTLWEYQPHPQKVLSERISLLVAEILRMVMEAGTGQAAKDDVKISMDIEDKKFDFGIPVFGKTGTANKYMNSSFVGFIPGVGDEAESFNLKDGYVIASYVGYDDNRPMQSEHMAIAGASGALPLWIDTVNTILNYTNYKQPLQAADLAFGPDLFALWKKQGLQSVPISNLTGLPIHVEESGTTTHFHEIFADVEMSSDHLIKKRFFEPFEGVPDEN